MTLTAAPLPIRTIPVVAYVKAAPVTCTESYTYTGSRTDIGLVQHIVVTAVGLGMRAVSIENFDDGTFDLEIAGTPETFAALDAIILA